MRHSVLVWLFLGGFVFGALSAGPVWAASPTPSSTASSTTIEVPSWFGTAYAWIMERGGNRFAQAKDLGGWLMKQGQSLLDQQDALRAVAVERFQEFQTWLQNFLGWGKPALPTTPTE